MNIGIERRNLAVKSPRYPHKNNEEGKEDEGLHCQYLLD
jgi:hypothetical protein